MYLRHLSLTNYRAYTRLDMEVPRRVLMLVGDNAQGKTTVLESVYFLATFTSLLAQSDRQLINWAVKDEPLAVARLVADYQRGERLHRMEVRIIQEGGINGGSRLRKEILLDGVKKSAQEALGQFNAVVFLPQMMHIMDGGPEERRRYLNLVISQAVPGYGKTLSDYAQALTQRNALLKLLAERGGDASQLDYWDDLICKRGAVLIDARNKAIQELEINAAQIHRRLTNDQENLKLVYAPSFDPGARIDGQYVLPTQSSVLRNGISVEQIQQGFASRLVKARGEEIARGVTTVGPHRDDLHFLSNGMDLGDFGSRGQSRTALLSLKLAEVAWLKDKTGHWPVLLLDEILAELDGQRRAALMEALTDCEQSILTTTDSKLFSDDFLQKSTVWHLKNGCVSLTDF